MTALKIAHALGLSRSAGDRSRQTQTIEYSKVFSVRHLAGVAMDSTGATVPDVKIEICKEDWSDCFASTTTGTDGRFSVARLPLVNLYYVKVSAPGFDILRIKVHLRSIARKNWS